MAALEDLRPHIAELRDRLIKCVVVVAIAFCLLFRLGAHHGMGYYAAKRGYTGSGQVVAVKKWVSSFYRRYVPVSFASWLSRLLFYQLWSFLFRDYMSTKNTLCYLSVRHRNALSPCFVCVLFCFSGRLQIFGQLRRGTDHGDDKYC